MSDHKDNRQDIAARIRELRDSAGETVEAAAAGLGIKPELLAAYESGETDVPISALYEIAGRFGVDLTDLMTGKSPNLQHYCVVRDGKGPEVERYPGYRFQSLAFGFANRRFEPLLVTLDPEKNPEIKLVTHPGQEFNLVLSGRIRVILGSSSVELAHGDSIYFDPTLPHGQLALDDVPASFLTIILHDKEPLC
ncbi:MAG TPA: transcriptional regulator [Clostridiales bacterium]|nr:transcriptional regulator [Clostridiales bacterium]